VCLKLHRTVYRRWARCAVWHSPPRTASCTLFVSTPALSSVVSTTNPNPPVRRISLDGGNCDFLSRHSEERRNWDSLDWDCFFNGRSAFANTRTYGFGCPRICYFRLEDRRPHRGESRRREPRLTGRSVVDGSRTCIPRKMFPRMAKGPEEPRRKIWAEGKHEAALRRAGRSRREQRFVRPR